jgi:peptide/nickel transport system permease protein
MLRIITRRILLSVPLILVVSGITFMLESLVPGDPARSLLGVNATPQQYAALRANLHLNLPLVQQYWLYLGNVFRGNLGTSIFTGQPVSQVVASRVPVTLSLVIGATVVAAAAGTLLGVYSATRGRLSRRVVDVLSLLGNALPGFWVALALAAIFAVKLGWFPATGYTSFGQSPQAWLASLALPVIALSIGGVALIAKITRDAMLSTLQLDYIRTLRASGVSPRSVIWRHALRNSGLALVTTIGLTMISFLAGAVIIENVFVLPGLGNVVVSATNEHDIPVVQGIALTFTIMVIVVNLLVDIAYGLLNPKVRTS